MGWEVHICRTIYSWESERYPILEHEWHELVRREADLCFDPNDRNAAQPPDGPGDRDMFWWVRDPGVDVWFMYSRGDIRTKHPDEPTIRRMIGIANALDAWVTGDDPVLFELDTDGNVTERQPSLEYILQNLPRPLFITRGTSRYGPIQPNPISYEEWMDLVSKQPDFRVERQVEATLPAGKRMIACPPLAVWNGHPSGKPVPFFFDEDAIEVRGEDEHTFDRMINLAASLTANVLNTHGYEVRSLRLDEWPSGGHWEA